MSTGISVDEAEYASAVTAVVAFAKESLAAEARAEVSAKTCAKSCTKSCAKTCTEAAHAETGAESSANATEKVADTPAPSKTPSKAAGIAPNISASITSDVESKAAVDVLSDAEPNMAPDAISALAPAPVDTAQPEPLLAATQFDPLTLVAPSNLGDSPTTTAPSTSGTSVASSPFQPVINLILSLGGAAAAILLLVPALVFVMWLTLVSADFLSLNRFGPGLARPWYDFAMRVSLGVLLPPFIIAGLGSRYPWHLRLIQASRAALITFFLYAVCFFGVGWVAFTFVSGMRVGVVPELLRRMGPWVFCLLLWVSYRLTAYLLPPKPVQDLPPFTMRLFSSLALVVVASLLLMALAPLAPLGLPALAPDFYDIRALPQDILLYMGTAIILFRRGWGVFRTAWVVLCIIGPFATLYEATLYPLPWQIFHSAMAAVALASCFCLYTPSSRRWLTD